MKILYLESKRKPEAGDYPDFSKLPKRIGLLYTIQFRDTALDVKNRLEQLGKKVFMARGARGKHEGQVLGCDAGAAIYIIEDVDCFLFISSGKWHAERIALSLTKDRPFFVLTSEGLEKIDSSALKKSRETALKKFILADRIGLIVSTKPGQENLKNAQELMARLEQEGKQAFLFISDMINPSEFENFKIGFWINTACPGLAFDFPNMLNIAEVYKYLNKSL